MAKIKVIDFLKNVEYNRQQLMNYCKDMGIVLPENTSLTALIQTVINNKAENVANKHLVRFFDLDGTCLYSQYVEDGGSVIPPKSPNFDSEHLVFKNWQSALGIDTFNGIFEDIDYGALYAPKNNGIYFKWNITSDILTIKLSLYATNTIPVTIDWGDGIIDTITPNPGSTDNINGSSIKPQHTYSNTGVYWISIYPPEGYKPMEEERPDGASYPYQLYINAKPGDNSSLSDTSSTIYTRQLKRVYHSELSLNSYSNVGACGADLEAICIYYTDRSGSRIYADANMPIFVMPKRARANTNNFTAACTSLCNTPHYIMGDYVYEASIFNGNQYPTRHFEKTILPVKCTAGSGLKYNKPTSGSNMDASWAGLVIYLNPNIIDNQVTEPWDTRLNYRTVPQIDPVKLNRYAYYNYDKFPKSVIFSKVSSIDMYAFKGCNAESIVLNVPSCDININAFTEAKCLKNLVLFKEFNQPLNILGTKLDKSCLIDMLSKLKDNSDSFAQTLTVGDVVFWNMSNLYIKENNGIFEECKSTDEGAISYIAALNAKNWTISHTYNTNKIT